MEPEWMVMRVAYMVLFITLALMAWAYMVQAEAIAAPLVAQSLLAKGHQGNVLDVYPPCSFNPLCTCSKPGPTEFGIVACHDVPFGNIPLTLNSSRAFLLSMVGNNLQVLDNKRLVTSGLWRLEIKENNLNYVADDAFIGLSKFLSELDLQCNQLTNIPTNALRRLSKPGKLKILDLGYNKITDVNKDDFGGLTSITRLGLSANMISYIEEDAFTSLPRLEKLDLSDNSIQFIHNNAFTSLSRSLMLLYLQNNLLQKIPFQGLSSLELKTLDLSNNLITTTFDIFFEKKLNVGILKLNYNRISSVPPFAFQNFRRASSVSLAFNPIDSLVDDAFKDAEIEELDISNCFIREVQPKAFRGLENTLISLDMSSNNITELPFELFSNFDRLRHLNLDQNRLKINPDGLDNFRLFTLYRFSIVGDMMAPFSMEDIQLMRNLRSLNISNFGMASLTPEVFSGLGLAVEDIKISQGKLKTIKAGAFSSLTGLKSIDISENRIERIEEAFEGVEHSLLRLKMINALRMGTLPSKAFHKLSAVQYLDLSSNGLNNVPEDTFAESKRLQYLNLRFNKISSIPKTMFACSKVPRIQRIFLSFNNIKEVKESAFSRLKEIEFIELNENSIETIHRRGFEDLTNLRILNLAGNKLSILNDEAFLNLPRLQILDLSHNRLTSINFDAFEQLGTLSSFQISFSHNKIQRLIASTEDLQRQDEDVSAESGDDASDEDEPIPVPSLSSISSSSIESIDLSFNNISFISPHFFFPISSTLIELDLSHNRLQNLTLEHLSGMRFIQYVKLDHNSLDTIEYNSFRESKYIQFINLDHNMLRDIPPDLFEGCLNLRVLSATDNKIRALTDSIFKDTQLEILNLANNQLVRFPENALARVAATLVQLDLSGNEISSLAPNQVECLQKLKWIDFSNNRIVVIAENTFENLNLFYLDISSNHIGKLSARMFDGIKETLLHLHIANMTLDNLPEFDTFSKLLTFNASYNRLTYLPTNFGVNVSNLRTLDISGNEIPAPPNTIWHTIPRLSQVFMQDNPIRSLTNDSFLQLEHLHELDISNLPLESVQVGVFTPLVCLKQLSIGPLSPSINPGLIIQAVESLQEFHLKLDVPIMSSELISYPLPQKTSSIIVSGEELLSISAGAFEEVGSRQLQLVIDGTGITDLSDDVLHQLGDATQLSLKITGNNSALKTISNPNSQFRKEPFVTYLERLELDESLALSCSCETGWIEFWLRQWMEKTCPIWSPTPKDESLRCNKMLQMLRNVNCHNKPGTDLMHAFISDLECGWESSASAFWSHVERLHSILMVSLFSVFLLPTWMLRI
ncbi:unnamed protein product [Orchesella dallaii]|uniref:Chaoptin n=1 Tax=Orchesella dallaii TaxID=48710 RepID=A0ABP1QJ07_9HEXA